MIVVYSIAEGAPAAAHEVQEAEPPAVQEGEVVLHGPEVQDVLGVIVISLCVYIYIYNRER